MTFGLQRLGTDFFSKLPVELILKVNENLTIADKLSLADTCRAYRSLITNAECTQACMMAGLSIPPHATAREMAKLLCQLRVGVCNWSYDGGIPKSECRHKHVPDISSHHSRQPRQFLGSHLDNIRNPGKSVRCPPSSIPGHELHALVQDIDVRNDLFARRKE